jgi:glycosyltransferase involved in cell wall biosynthesis
MRVGIFLGYQPREFGGGYTYLENVVEELINDKGRHEYYFFHYGERFSDENKRGKFISLEQFPGSMGDVPAFSFQLLKYKIDVCWFMAPPYEHVHIPFICTVWDLEHRKQPFFPEVSQTGWTWDLREKNYRDFLPRAAYVITGTEKGKGEIHFFYQVLKERIKVIPFPTPNWVIDYRDKYDVLLNDVPKPFLFYPAQFWSHKNHVVLLYTLKILIEKYSHDFYLVFTGSDMGNLAHVKSVTKRLGLKNRIIFKGFVDRYMLASLYKNAFALVYPSFFGPDNFPPLEAFAFRCPVFASSMLGAHEHIKEAAILFDPRSEEDIAGKIHTLYLDQDLRETMIEKGYAFSKKRKTADCVNEMVDIINDFERYRRAWSTNTLYRNFDPASTDVMRNMQFSIDDIYSRILDSRKKNYFSASLIFSARKAVYPVASKIPVRNLLKHIHRGLVSTHLGRKLLKPGLLSPGLGVLYHHEPKPLSIPKHYASTMAMDSCPVISIVTPSLNQSDFIERTIKSVLSQDYPQLQYIIKDGGSSDDTENILEKYRKSFSHYESAEDRGQSNALNIGFRYATGEIMGYLNSDDLLLPGALHYVADFFKRHPDVDVVYGHRILIDAVDREIGRWVLPPHEDEILFWADYVPQETLFWRRRIWDKVGGHLDESFQFAMDWDLILRFCEAGAKFARLPRFLGAFRVHQDQKTSAKMEGIGKIEIDRLRQLYHKRVISQEEIGKNIRKYLVKHIFYNMLYKFRLLRY